MSKNGAWMPLYVSDYLDATTRLTTEQHGAYLLLLMDYWRHGPLPDNDAMLKKITNLSQFSWKKTRPILMQFFDARDGKLFNARADEEMAKAEALKDKRSQKAKTAADARWHAENSQKTDATSNAPSTATSIPASNASGMPQAMPPAREHSHSPIEDNNQPLSTASHARASQPPDDRSIARLVDVEFIGEQARILAGLSELSAGDTVQLRLWMGDGITGETILDTIRAVMANTDDHTSSLRRFDKPIRKAHAKTLAGPSKANGNGAARYVSATGHVYHGSPQAVMREAEKRADWTTYYQAKSDTEQRS